MKHRAFLAGLAGLFVLEGVPSVHAAGDMRVACKKELKSFHGGTAAEQEAHKCLESHEAFEKKSGAEEKDEAHG